MRGIDSRAIAGMVGGSGPPDDHVISVGHYGVDGYPQIGKGGDNFGVLGFELVYTTHIAGFQVSDTLGREEFVDRFDASLIPDLFEPPPGKLDVGVAHGNCVELGKDGAAKPSDVLLKATSPSGCL